VEVEPSKVPYIVKSLESARTYLDMREEKRYLEAFRKKDPALARGWL
jgi:hypothetical protein